MKQWLRWWIIGASMVALLVAVAIPHQHDHANASHPPAACRACKIQDSYAGTPPASVVETLGVTSPSHRLIQIDERIALTLVASSSLSRAPPRSS